jgi:hypothetical protein
MMVCVDCVRASLDIRSSMGTYRILLAAVIALAVAVAPVAAALAPSGLASVKSAMDDCHGKAHVLCPDCDSKIKKAKCPADGSQCCKLVGSVAAAPRVMLLAGFPEAPLDPPQLLGWLQRPQPPPPRS